MSHRPAQLLPCPWYLEEPRHSSDVFLKPCSKDTSYPFSAFLDCCSQRGFFFFFFFWNPWNVLLVSWLDRSSVKATQGTSECGGGRPASEKQGCRAGLPRVTATGQCGPFIGNEITLKIYFLSGSSYLSVAQWPQVTSGYCIKWHRFIIFLSL